MIWFSYLCDENLKRRNFYYNRIFDRLRLSFQSVSIFCFCLDFAVKHSSDVFYWSIDFYIGESKICVVCQRVSNGKLSSSFPYDLENRVASISHYKIDFNFIFRCVCRTSQIRGNLSCESNMTIPSKAGSFNRNV